MCNNNVKAIMKKIYSFLFAATALFAASSCQKEFAPEVETPNYEKITFTASTEVDTKTALHENGKSTVWVAGDQISVFDANKEGNNRCFAIEGISEDKLTATFSYEGEFVKDNTQADPTVVALYPYQAKAYCDFFYYDRNYITGLNFPAEQTAVAGGFDPKAGFALGLGTMGTMELGFQNLYSLIKFTVTTANVKEVTVTFGGENAYVAGDAKIQMTLNTEKIGGSEPVFESPVLSIVENGTNTVKLSCKNGFSTEATYYIAVVPTSYESISVAYDGVVVKEIEKANTLQANKIYNLGSYPEEFVPQEGYVYLKPNSNWKTDNARFAAYFFSQKWADMTLVERQVNVYQCAIPEGEEGGMLFCRMNPNNTENRWNVDNEANAPVWNQTIDLSLTDGCVYTMNDGSWDTGTWSGNPAVEKPVLPEVAPGVDSNWALAGTFNAWGNTIFKTTSTSGLFVIENLALDSGDEIKVKVVEDWNTSYGGGIINLKQNCWMKVYSNGANIPVSAKGTYDVYFDQLNTKLYLMAAGVDYTTAAEQNSNGPAPTTPSEWYIVGNFNNWNPADPNYRMSDDGTYYIFDNFTAASGCELKFAPGKWSNDRGASSFKVGSWVSTVSGGSNIKVTAGKYKIYLKKDLSQYKFEKK